MNQDDQSAMRDADAAHIDALTDEFERALKAGQSPPIEGYMGRIGEGLRPIALRELLKVEVELRRGRQESISVQEYVDRFPDLQAVVAEVCRQSDVLLASAERAIVTRQPAAVGARLNDSAGGSGRLEIRCPSCHTPMEVAVDTLLTDLTCNSCGSHFSLVDQSQPTRMAPPLTKLGRFELIERLGFGGFGSVWKARDKELDRTVAIKIPRAGGMTAEEQEKFFREARAAAQLRHPNIVSVHEVGRDGDSLYIVSDFVRGVTLGDWLTGQQLTGREAAELCAKIADALEHAHQQGVVHRDLKPANIMIDGDGEPHLMDFGLARREVGEVTMTLDGQILGTPAYMSPEQAQGEAHTADRRSDVYSLGVVLFQLLTGELPFRGNARMLMHQVIHDDPPSPRKLNANIKKDLETITLKSLEKSPARRYQSGRELADDLRRFLHGEPIVARPVPRWERSAKWVRRHPAPSALIVLFCIATLGGIAGWMWYERTRHEADVAKANAQQFAKFLAGAFESADPIHFGNYRFGDSHSRVFDPQTFLDRGRQYVEDAKPHLDPATRARLLNSIGGAYAGSGRLSEAYNCMIEALDVLQKLNGEVPTRELASTLHNLGLLGFLFGRFAESEDYLRQALELEKKLFANQAGRGEIITTKVWLAATLLETQRGPEIKQLLEEVVDARSPELKAYDRDFALAALALALVSTRLGEFEAAMARYQQAKEILKESGDELADVMDLATQSVIQSVFADDQAAVASLQRALDKAEQILGQQHPVLYVFRLDLAEALERMGDPEKARQELENLLASARRLFGDQPRTAVVLTRLGDVSRDLNNPNDALTYYQDAEEMLDPKVDHFYHADVGLRLGMMALRESRGPEARRLFQRTIDLQKHLRSGMQHPLIACGHVGMALIDPTDPEITQQELKRAADIMTKLPGDRTRVVAALASFGDTLWQAQLADRAELVYRQALVLHDRPARPASPGFAQSLFRQAEQLFAPSDGFPIGRANLGLGRCLLHKGLKDDARPYLERAAKIFDKHLNQQHPRAIEVRSLLDGP